VSEPRPRNPFWPRYTSRPFPPYRFVPGRTPHPHRDRRGHSYGLPESTPALCPPDRWYQAHDYLYGIDLYNFAYWWECHEIFEALWKTAGRGSAEGNFFQALIQLAAAHLKRFTGNRDAAGVLVRNCVARLERTPEHYMGVDVTGLIAALHPHLTDGGMPEPLILLTVPERRENDLRIIR
jgi:predicted metal-dependent hydrolase